MAKLHLLQYTISLTDRATFEAAQAEAAAGYQDAEGVGWIFGMSPEEAADVYDAPIILPGVGFFPPCTTSGYFGTNANFPTNVPQFTRKSGGWFGLPIFEETDTYVWVGLPYWAGSEQGTSEVPGQALVNMAVRTWVDGFENGQGTAPTSTASASFSPAASRHRGGYGFPCHDGDNGSVLHRHTESGHAATDRGWERFYVRLRKPPNVQSVFWVTAGATSSNAGARLAFTVSGQIALINCSSGGVETVIGTTSALELNRWYKLDVLYRYGAAPDGFAKLYIGGVQAAGFTAGDVAAGTGIAQAQNHNGSTLSDGPSNNRGAWDFDDWIGMELPQGGSNPTLFPARDWNTGSKVVPLLANGPGALGDLAGPGGANANDWRFLSQRPFVSTLIQGLSTSSASQVVTVQTNAAQAIDTDPQNRGMAAAQVTVGSTKASGGATATVAIDPGGGGSAGGLLTVNEPTTVTNTTGFLCHTGGLLEPIYPMAGTTLSMVMSSAAAVAKVLYSIIGQVECLGNFYIEDYVPQVGDPAGVADGFPRHWINDLHQHWFPEGPWAPYGQAAPSIVVNHCGTYVGNGTSQVLAFRTPPAWIYIRNTATHEGATWHVAAPSSRRGVHESTRPTLMPRVYIDPNFAPAAEDDQSQQTIVVIAGNNVGNNANGVTYNYFCFQDAGQRFSEAGALWETSAADVARVTSLNNAEFVPEFGLFHVDARGNAVTSGFYVKGLGANASELIYAGGAALATGLEWAAGALTLPVSSGVLAALRMSISFLVLRRDDGSGDVGIPNVMQLASWTGDGSASRTIGLSPATGRRPMWAIVVGSNGNSRMRDASHTGTVSQNVSGEITAASDGITAGGIDSISVGSALNGSGVRYEAWVVPGCSATAGNAGWGVNCESIPVGPVSPVPPYLPPPSPVPPETPTTPPPGGTPTIPPIGTVTQCLGPSTLVINMALGRIGSSKQLVSTTLNTEVSQEATVCRLHFDEDVKQCLRDFPWQFATRYAKLEVVGGPAEEQDLDLVPAWSILRTYHKNDVVQVGGVLYYALTTTIAHPPASSPAQWTTEAPENVNGDWLYSYRVPSDFLFARRIVDPEGRGREWDPEPPPFRLGSDGYTVDTGLALIYSNQLEAELEYTHLAGCASYEGDALFRSALAWRHAHSIAPAIARDEKKGAYCWEMYQRLLRDARAASAQEQQQTREGDVDWIEGRN